MVREARGGEMCKRYRHKELSLVTVYTIPQQGIFNLTTADFLITANIYVGYRSKHPDKQTLKDVVKDLQENDINVVQLVASWTKHCK